MPDQLDQLRSALAGRYAIERELGRGGNAVVYLAQDKKHDRKVALKVLLAELALAVRAERFLREIQIAAKLTHPHILALHDSGEIDGLPYYVMPYVEGESLRDRLDREKQLPLEDALAITRDVAEALGYAHKQGVVHRDIKPENIMLSEGGAIVADFGIARALSVAGGQAVTESGIAVGTPAYMSPEQGAASGEPDGRSDIYSLGCVLYEMLAGRPPFTGATAQEVLARHAVDPVPSLRAARDSIPETVQRTLLKALAKQPVDRFSTATQFAAALATGVETRRSRRTLVTAAISAVALTVAAVTYGRRWVPPVAAEQSVAVLSFRSLSTNPEDEYLAEGIADELISALKRIEGLKVPGPTTSFAFKGKNVSEREIARELRVQTVLSGSLRRSGGHLRVSVRLVNAADGFQLWSETYDRELKDVFAVQDDIARSIVAALELKLTGADTTAIVRTPTGNVLAYELYLKGRYLWNRRGAENFREAIRSFEAAVALDSGYALAHSGLADVYVLAGIFNYLPRVEAWPKAKAAAIRALALDSNLAEAHTSLSRAIQTVDRDWDGAEAHYRRAIALNPRYPLARSWYGQFLGVIRGRDRFAEAVREATIAVESDPLAPAMSFNLGHVYLAGGRHDDAVREFRKAVALQPEWPQARRFLGRAYFDARQFAEAMAEFQAALQLEPGHEETIALVGAAHSRMGRFAEALRILQDLKTGRRVPLAEAILCAQLGDQECALTAFELAVRSTSVGAIAVGGFRDPVLRPIWTHPRFLGTLKNVGVAPPW